MAGDSRKKQNMVKRFLIICCLLANLVLSGCFHVISRQALSAVTPCVGVAELLETPQAHIGKSLLLGGLIVANSSGLGNTTLEIIPWQLDHFGEPVAYENGEDRFLAVSDQLLPAELYAPGRLVTLTGTVIGIESCPLDGIPHDYPLLRVGEVYLWDTPLRYRQHPSIDPYLPEYDPPWYQRNNPYDSGYAPYPYSPDWLRR